MATAPSHAEITAGGYLRLRRERTGLTQRDTALLYASAPNVTAAELMIADIEADRLLASDTALAKLRDAFPFDPAVYRDLRDGLRMPQICRVCGCTFSDPCINRRRGACAWSSDPSLCTHCVGPTPVPSTPRNTR